MISRLAGRRFRETQWLIIAALALLFGMVLVEMKGMLTLARSVEDEAKSAVIAAAEVWQIRGALGASRRDLREGVGVARLLSDEVVERIGLAGPTEPAWWPWSTRAEWMAAGRSVAGPVRLGGGQVVVAYRELEDRQAVRIVLQVSSAGLVGAWRWIGAALGVFVALGGGLLAILLIGRALQPYQDLMEEARKVASGQIHETEDRFLVETFRETVQRLELSEAAVRQRADELAVLAEVLTREASSGVVVTDSDGIVTACNPVARSLVGASLQPGEPMPAVLRFEGREIEHGDRTLEIRRIPLLSAAGAAQGEVTFLVDQTSWVAMERALRERDQMATLGELSAGMAHELRNALATIRGYLRLMPEAEPAAAARFVGVMSEETESVSRLLDRFLSFAQPQEIRHERVRLLEVAREAVARVQAAFPAVSLGVYGEAGEVRADRMALLVALENLVRNAAEAVPTEAGEVTVRVESHTNAVAVTVEDNGPGVSDEVRARLFQPFASTKPSGGMGLAIARRFARLHGGDVECQDSVGRGARFVLRVPLGEGV
jgi:signal transduction histidine kinase